MAVNPLAALLGRGQLALAPTQKSLLVQKLLESSRTPTGLVSPAGVANKALQGLFARRAFRQEQEEQELMEGRQQALAGALSRSGREGAQGEAARRAAMIIAGGLPGDPLAQKLLEGQAARVFGPEEPVARVHSAQILANGNIGFIDRFTGEVVDTGEKASENFFIGESPSGAPFAVSRRTGRGPEGEQPITSGQAIFEAGQRSGAEKLSDVGIKRFDEQFVEASEARATLNIIDNAERLLDAGITTGTAAGARNAIARALDTILGRETDESALSANTDAYIANAGQLVGQVIKQFGSGTGLSDADREYAARIAGGSVEMNEAALRRILDIQRKAQTHTIERYNRQFQRLAPKFTEISAFYEPITLPGQDSGRMPDFSQMSDEELQRLINGQ